MKSAIPLILTRDQVNALLDVWDTHESLDDVPTGRYFQALEVMEWLRHSLQRQGLPPFLSRGERVRVFTQNITLRVKFLMLRFWNPVGYKAVYLSQDEARALKRLLVLQKPADGLERVIERLRE